MVITINIAVQFWECNTRFCTQDASTLPLNHNLTLHVLLHNVNIILNMDA